MKPSSRSTERLESVSHPWVLCALLALIMVGCSESENSQTEEPTVGTDFVWVNIAGGVFEQGNANATDDMGDEQPVRVVDVPTFDMLKTEVTVSQYDQCVQANVCSEPDTGDAGTWNAIGQSQHPVNYVNWNQAVVFCQWVGGRLPTESEWEYAARNQGRTLYPWGNDKATCQHAVMVNGEGDGCGTGQTHLVCSRSAGNTELGLCDMIGNVWEWTLDWYHPSYDGAPTDGSAWVQPRGTSRTMRGGAFTYDAFWNRATSRDSHGNPAFQVRTLGFRCVRGMDVEADYDAPVVELDVVGETNLCGETDCDFGCLGSSCSNSNGNTHSECGCDADYCVPDEPGVEFAGLTPLTCTTSRCDPNNASTCPVGTECKVIPPFVLDMFAQKGVNMPSTMCGKP